MPAVQPASPGPGHPVLRRPDDTASSAGDVPRYTLHALGTLVMLSGCGAERVATEIVRYEQILTRFRPSALTYLNASGRLERPPVELVDALLWALAAADVSGGLVTPLIGRNLSWHGYERSWPEVHEAPPGEPPPIPPYALVHAGREMISLPAGSALDLGGTGKGFIGEEASSSFHGPFVLDAGGDVLLASQVPTQIAVEVPPGAEPWHLVLPPGRWGVATSSVTHRAWRGAHHLIDPRTRRPVDGRWLQATVVSPSLREAEIATKLVLFGVPLPPRLRVAGAWATDGDGRQWTNTKEGWRHDPHDN